MLRRLGGALYTRRWIVLLLALALTIVAGVYGSSVGEYLSSDSAGGKDTISQQADNILNNHLSTSRVDVVVLFESATLHVSDPRYQRAVTQALAPLQNDAAIANVTTFYMNDNAGLVSRDQHATFATVRFKNLNNKTADYNQLNAQVHSSLLHVSLGGAVVSDKQFADQTDADLAKMEDISFPAILIALVFVFGGLAAAVLPLVVGGVAILGALSLLRILAGSIAISTYAVNIVTLLGLGLAIDYALFIITRFREELATDENDVHGALQRTVATAGRTVLFSGLTVSLSLLSLTIFPLATLRSLGIGSICAVLMAMLSALIVLPATLAVMGKRVNALSVTRLMRRFVQEPDVLASETPAKPTPQLVTRYTLPGLAIILGLIIVVGVPSLGFMPGLVLAVVIGGALGGWLSLVAGGLAAGGALLMQHVIVGMVGVSPEMSAIAAIVGLGLALDYIFLYLARFRVALARDESDVRGALIAAYWATLRPIGVSAWLIGTVLLIIAATAATTLHTLALATLVALLIALAVALVALPVVLAMVRPWISALSWFQVAHGIVMAQQRRAAAHAASGRSPEGAWYRLSQSVMQFPIPIILGVGGLLLLLGTPILQAQFAAPDGRALPPSKSARYVFDHLNADFPQQSGSQQVIAVLTPGDATDAANMTKLTTYVNAIRAVPHVASVTSIVPTPATDGHAQSAAALSALDAQLANGNATQINVMVNTTDNSAEAQQVVRDLRAITPPAGFATYVGGTTAAQLDLFDVINSHLWQALAVIMLSTLVLLFLMTGSIVVPLKAIALNVLSLSATFGAIVFIFQQGHFRQQLGFTPLGSVDPAQLVIVFAIAFGLSMDYEVFLLSRIKEQYDLTKDNRYAVASGLQRTGRLVTSAALLLSVVLIATSTSEIIFVKEIGLGLAIAVLMDASLVRTLLVPATMRLLGKANWWPNLQVISESEAPTPAPIPALASPFAMKPAYAARNSRIVRRDITVAGIRQNSKALAQSKQQFVPEQRSAIAPAGFLEALDPQQLQRKVRSAALRRRPRLATNPIAKPPQFTGK